MAASNEAAPNEARMQIIPYYNGKWYFKYMGMYSRMFKTWTEANSALNDAVMGDYWAIEPNVVYPNYSWIQQ